MIIMQAIQRDICQGEKYILKIKAELLNMDAPLKLRLENAR